MAKPLVDVKALLHILAWKIFIPNCLNCRNDVYSDGSYGNLRNGIDLENTAKNETSIEDEGTGKGSAVESTTIISTANRTSKTTASKAASNKTA